MNRISTHAKDILLMYHTNKLNQVSVEKNLSSTALSHKHSQFDHYSGDINSYISTCTPFEQDIASIFLKFRNAANIYLTNQYIALLVGCCRRTVTRTTNKFHKDGFVTKHQPNQYASNYYTLNDVVKKGTHTFSHWFNSLPSTTQDLYISHGIIVDHKNKKICSDVTPNKSSLILDSLFRKEDPLTRAHARGYGNKSEKYKKGVALVSEFQKKWILSNRTDPRVKDMLNHPRIKSALITPAIEKIGTLLTLDEREQLKLIAFSDAALDYALNCIEPIVTGKKAIKNKIDDRMGWLMAILNGYNKKHTLLADWAWYYNICDIIGADPKTLDLKKPLVIQATVAPTKAQGIYAPWKSPEEPPIDIRIQELRVKLTEHEKNIENNTVPKFAIDYLHRVIAQMRQELTDLESQAKNLRSGYEKQIVSSQYSTYSMATCSA